jgi:hypothetical protein
VEIARPLPRRAPGPAGVSAIAVRLDGRVWFGLVSRLRAAAQRLAGLVRRPEPRGRTRRLAYAPQRDGRADPGEIVWTWVAYEDDPRQGKDRPVLVIGRDGEVVLGLMLSSQDDRDGQPHWLALGVGTWDQEERPSWVRLDRVLRMAEDSIRREGAVLDRSRFDVVARALRAGGYGWI